MTQGTLERQDTAVDEGKLERLRAELPSLQSTVYLNVGSNGPIPRPAHEALLAAADEDFRVGRANLSFYYKRHDEAMQLRSTIAGIFNAKPSEVALMRSTTEGMNAALNGIEWQRGDEIITTQLEHPGLYSPLSLMSFRHGVVMRTVDIGDGGGDVLGQLEAVVTSRTRAVALSHVTWSTGAVLPLKEIAAFARSRGILTIVDAAQGGGHVPVDFRDLGVDAYCIAGQKWLCGPNSTGIMLIHEDRLGDIRPTYLRGGTFDTAGFVLPFPGAQRYEMGENYGPAIVSFDKGLQWLRDEAGFDWMAARTKKLGERAFDALSQIDGVTMMSPRHVMAGLVCFNVRDWVCKDVAEECAARGYTIRFVEYKPGPTVARVATAWWCTEDEIDRFCEQVADLARNPKAAA